MMKKNTLRPTKQQRKYLKLILEMTRNDAKSYPHPGDGMSNCCYIVELSGFAADAAVPVVQDSANVLSAEQKAELEQLGIQLDKATTAELAVLITSEYRR